MLNCVENLISYIFLKNGSDTGLPLFSTMPLPEQILIFWSIGPPGTNFSGNFKWNSNIFIDENTIGNVVCKTSSILFSPQCSQYHDEVMTWKHFHYYDGPLWGESQKARNEGFDVFFDVNLNKWLNKQSSCQWIKMPWHPCDVTILVMHCNTHAAMTVKLSNQSYCQTSKINRAKSQNLMFLISFCM